MQSVTVGGSGLSISRVALGGYELGHEVDEDPDVDRAVRVIQQARGAGINWLDTSENYHATRNESLIGAALARVGGEFLVASKLAPCAALTGGGSGFRRDQVREGCLGSLKRLGRERIDLYFLHWPDETGVPLAETWGAMAELKEEGLVGAIGLSNYELADIERCHQQHPVDVVQDGLSMIDHLDNRPTIAACGELGIAVTIYEPMGSGILTDKTPEDVLSLFSGVWEEAGFYQRLLAPGRIERSFAVADELRRIAQPLGVTAAQLAVAWVLHQPGVSAAICGSRSGGHVRENAEAGELDLTEVLKQLDELIKQGPSVAAAD